MGGLLAESRVIGLGWVGLLLDRDAILHEPESQVGTPSRGKSQPIKNI